MRSLRSSRAATPAFTTAALLPDPVPERRSVSAPDAPLSLRLKVRLERTRLDRRIARGEPCREDPGLSLRAAQLASPESQRATAQSLRGVLDYVDRHGSKELLTSVLILPRAVRGARAPISELAEQLERGGEVNPRGVALAGAFLCDGASPLFNPHSTRTVAEVVADVRAALAAPAELDRGR